MKISEIEIHRNSKLQSLLCGKLDEDLLKFRQLCKKVNLTPEDLLKIEKTLNYVTSQSYGDHPLLKHYVSHPIRVAILVLEWLEKTQNQDTNFIIAALIHNVIEKNIMTFDEIQGQYGSWIANVIVNITVNRKEQKLEGWAKNYYYNISKLDPKGQLLKAFDKFDNIYALCLNPDLKVRTDYLQEIEDYITPIIKNHAPHQTHYFIALIQSTKELGHIDMNKFIQESQ